jgi:hypothetical protein
VKENRQRQETKKPVRINLKMYQASKTKHGTTKNHKKPTEMKQRKSFGFSPQLLVEHDSSAFDTLLRTKKCLLIYVITSCQAQNKLHPMVSISIHRKTHSTAPSPPYALRLQMF